MLKSALLYFKHKFLFSVPIFTAPRHMKYCFLSLACSLRSSMKDAQEWLRKLLTTQLKEIGNAEFLAGVSAESNY